MSTMDEARLREIEHRLRTENYQDHLWKDSEVAELVAELRDEQRERADAEGMIASLCDALNVNLREASTAEIPRPVLHEMQLGIERLAVSLSRMQRQRDEARAEVERLKEDKKVPTEGFKWYPESNASPPCAGAVTNVPNDYRLPDVAKLQAVREAAEAVVELVRSDGSLFGPVAQERIHALRRTLDACKEAK